MHDSEKRKIEFGDFQTPYGLANEICKRLSELGINPELVVEPTCGVGAFLIAASEVFPNAKRLLGFDINPIHLESLQIRLQGTPGSERIHLEQADFFSTDWSLKIERSERSVLILGNFPWVTNSVQSIIGGSNLPEKSNFFNRNGFEAISGKSNFDISEWMLMDVMRWLNGRSGDIAMLVKTGVARKVLAHIERQQAFLREAFIIQIDAKKHFNAAVEACLLVIRLSHEATRPSYDYTIYESLDDTRGRRVGHRNGLTIGNLESFEKYKYLAGQSPQKWRSGIKHDAAAVMEISRTDRGLCNGFGESVELEPLLLFPLLKGSDVGSGKVWREKYLLVPQRYVGAPTNSIKNIAPLTWAYLEKHSAQLDGRASTIYAKNPRYSIFGVGDYAFRPWRVAICGFYKSLNFRLVGPINEQPVMFDDTIYYLSFDTETEARDVLEKLTSEAAQEFLSSMIFWDEKRPIKTGILNVFDWSQLDSPQDKPSNIQLGFNLSWF